MSEVYTVLAFDVGLKRIGVAVGQSLTATATPLHVLPATPTEILWQRLDALVAEWRPAFCVIGLPTHADGSATAIDPAIKEFGNRLGVRYNVRVEWIDERLSSHAARNAARNEAQNQRRQQPKQKPKQKKGKADTAQAIDHYAAKIILESWFRHAQASRPTASDLHSTEPTERTA